MVSYYHFAFILLMLVAKEDRVKMISSQLIPVVDSLISHGKDKIIATFTNHIKERLAPLICYLKKIKQK